MAIPLIRTTYALDTFTVERLDRLARQWKISRSAALRRIVEDASRALPEQDHPVLAALDRLQERSRATAADIAQHKRRVQREREARTDALDGHAGEPRCPPAPK